MNKKNIGSIVACILIGCAIFGWMDYRKKQDRITDRIHQATRAQKLQDGLNAEPKVREIYTKYGALLEIKFSTDDMDIGILSTRTCYVWIGRAEKLNPTENPFSKFDVPSSTAQSLQCVDLAMPSTP
jgi:hypothetical protein